MSIVSIELQSFIAQSPASTTKGMFVNDRMTAITDREADIESGNPVGKDDKYAKDYDSWGIWDD